MCDGLREDDKEMLQALRKTHVTVDSRVLWLCNMVYRIPLSLLNGLVRVTNVAANLLRWYGAVSTDAQPLQTFEMANTKTGINVWLHKYIVT